MKHKTNCFILSLSLISAIAVLAMPSFSFGGCEKEEFIIQNKYIGTCGYTQSSTFTLEQDTYITRISIWYDTDIGGNTLSVNLSGTDGYRYNGGKTTKGSSQWSWCEGILNLNETLKAGTYTLTADSKSICSNPSGLTTLTIYGCDAEDPLPDDKAEGIDPPEEISVVDLTSIPSTAPVYMGNIAGSGRNAGTLSGKMELSVDFPAYNKPVDIWILIGLPDGRFYVADKFSDLMNLDEIGFLPIASGAAGSNTVKTILQPFDTADSDTPFDPMSYGVWTVYWLVAPESNGDIFQAIDNGNYELGFYIFEVKRQSSNSDVFISTMVEPDSTPQYFGSDQTIGLRIPEDMLDAPASLTVTHSKDFNIQPDDAFIESAFNISLGSINDLAGVMEIEIPYNPSKIPDGVDAEDFYGAVYFNQSSNKWDQASYKIDKSKNSITIYTDHLSNFATASDNTANTDPTSPMARSKKIYYLPSSVYNINMDTVVNIIESMNQNGEAGYDGIRAAWENVAENFGISNALITFTDGMLQQLMENDALNGLNDAMGDVGLGIALLKFYMAYDEGPSEAVLTLSKDIVNYAIGKWNNPLMKIASLGVFFIDYSLNRFAETAIEDREQMYVDAYNLYYRRGSTIASPPFKVRNGADWFKVFYQITKNITNAQNPRLLIDTEINNYVNAFWNDPSGMAFAFSEIHPGFTYTGGDNPSLENKISCNYKADLVNNYFQPIFRRVADKIRVEREQSLRNNEMQKIADILNQVYTINVTVSGAAKLDGLPVKIETKYNQEFWKGITSKDGKWQMKCTLLGYINAGLPEKVVLSGAGEQGADLEASLKLVDPKKSVEILFTIKDSGNNNCGLKEGDSFDGYNVVRVTHKDCNNYNTIPADIPLPFSLGPNGSIIPKNQSAPYGWKIKSLSGSWSCNTINLSFTIELTYKNPWFISCRDSFCNAVLTFTGNATLTADANGDIPKSGKSTTGTVSQKYNNSYESKTSCETPFSSN